MLEIVGVDDSVGHLVVLGVLKQVLQDGANLVLTNLHRLLPNLASVKVQHIRHPTTQQPRSSWASSEWPQTQNFNRSCIQCLHFPDDFRDDFGFDGFTLGLTHPST